LGTLSPTTLRRGARTSRPLILARGWRRSVSCKPHKARACLADSLRAAASRIVALHPEVFETLYHVVTDKPRRADRS